MENYKAILEQIKKNGAEAASLEEYIKNCKYSERIAPEVVKKAIQAEDLRLTNKYLSDNARRAFFAEVMPGIIEVFSKYDGKAYGEKTREKIHNEIKTRFNCGCYISASYYSQTLNIYSLNSDGFTDWNGIEIELNAAYDAEARETKNPLVNNKINLKNLEVMRLANCPEYVENIPARVAEIRAARNAAEEAWKQYEKAQAEYNKLTPSKMDHIYVTPPRLTWYFG